MSARAGGRGRAVGVWLRRSAFGAAAAILLVVGPGGTQAAGGVLDPSFGRGGKVITDLGGGSYVEEASAVAIQADGKIVATGFSNARGSIDFAVVRYTTRGRLDTSFGSGGRVLTDLGRRGDDFGHGVAIQADGKIVVAGYSDVAEKRDFALVRYTAAGKLDATFGSGGRVLTDLGAMSDDEAHAVVVQADGKIVVAGSSATKDRSDFALARYTPAGKLDAGFGRGGVMTASSGAATAYAVALQGDGKIVAAGSDRGDFAVARYTTRGRRDAGFGVGGVVLTAFGAKTEAYAEGVAVQKDGTIVAAGVRHPVQGDDGRNDTPRGDDFLVVRYTPGGKTDTSFASGGKVLTDLGGGVRDWASALAVQPDGKIVVAGSSDASGGGSFALVRYTTRGKLDTMALTAFGAKTSASAEALAVQRDGKVVAAGGNDWGGGRTDFALARYTLLTPE